MSDKIVRLQEFVNMYGSRGLSLLKTHTDEKLCLMSECHDLSSSIKPDMNLTLFSREDIGIKCNPNLLGTKNLLQQIATYNASNQCVMGLIFDDGDCTSLIIEMKVKK